MMKFRYRAMDPTGIAKDGFVVAKTAEETKERLEEAGFAGIKITDQATRKRSKNAKKGAKNPCYFCIGRDKNSADQNSAYKAKFREYTTTATKGKRTLHMDRWAKTFVPRCIRCKRIHRRLWWFGFCCTVLPIVVFLSGLALYNDVASGRLSVSEFVTDRLPRSTAILGGPVLIVCWFALGSVVRLFTKLSPIFGVRSIYENDIAQDPGVRELFREGLREANWWSPFPP